MRTIHLVVAQAGWPAWQDGIVARRNTIVACGNTVRQQALGVDPGKPAIQGVNKSQLFWQRHRPVSSSLDRLRRSVGGFTVILAVDAIIGAFCL